MVIAGACPGMVLPQVGTGVKNGWVTFLGGLTGAMVYLLLQIWHEKENSSCPNWLRGIFLRRGEGASSSYAGEGSPLLQGGEDALLLVGSILISIKINFQFNQFSTQPKS
jgi:hypothetical protein